MGDSSPDAQEVPLLHACLPLLLGAILVQRKEISQMIGICPRCGRELVRSSTPTGKVCFRCASCGGVAVTLPVLRESLDVRSIAVLTRSARAAEHAGCT